MSRTAKRTAKQPKSEKINEQREFSSKARSVQQPLLKSNIISNNGLTLEDIKSALTPDIPIEQVIYLNDNKVVTHENGSNRYYINYPDTWRTISNQQLVLGVRAIRKYGIGTYDLRLYLCYIMRGKEEKTCSFRFSRRVVIDEELGNEKQNILLEELNLQWEKQVSELSDEYKEYLTDVINRRWTLSFDSISGEWGYRCPYPTKSDEFTSSYDITATIINLSYDLQLLASNITITHIHNPHVETNYGCASTLWFRRDAFRDSKQPYLLAASFVTQTNYQYLGFTNTEFIPPKQYIIPNGETRFWIDVVTADGRDSHELSNDGRDLIAIELTLTTFPYKRRS